LKSTESIENIEEEEEEEEEQTRSPLLFRKLFVEFNSLGKELNPENVIDFFKQIISKKMDKKIRIQTVWSAFSKIQEFSDLLLNDDY